MKIVDLHCDTISSLIKTNGSLKENKGQFDLNRALPAGVCLQFFALFTYPADPNSSLRMVLKQIDKFYQEIQANHDLVYQLTSMSRDMSLANSRKLACLLHLEGGECLGTDTEILRVLYHLGLRSIGLTWNHRNLLADGAGECESGGGLSRRGREILAEMDRLGIMLDLAHISEKAFFDAMIYYDQPILVSHANSRRLCPHFRNLSDEQLKALAEHGGLIGITQVADFVKDTSSSLDDLLDHIVYMADLIGIEHVGLGSDFDGADNMVISDVSGYALLPEQLSRRGFTDSEIEMVMGKNALRIIAQVVK